MIMVIGPHKKKSEAKAHAGQSHSKSVPSPRPAAPAAQGDGAPTVAPELAASEPAAEGATVPGPA
jgi:hypothetical protein